MIKIFTIKKPEDYGNLQATIINNIDSKYVLVDANSAFREVYSYGKKELDLLMEYESNPKYSLTDIFPDYWLNNKDDIIERYNIFRNENNYLYFDESKIYSFIYDSIYIAIIDNMFNYAHKLEIAHDYSDFDSSELLRLFNLFDINHVNISEHDKEDFYNFLDTLNDLNEAPDEFEPQEIHDVNYKTGRGVMILEDYIYNLLFNKTRQDEYLFIDRKPFRDENYNKYFMSFSNNILGICFNKLSLNISGFNIDHSYSPCKYYKCLNYFTKVHNRTEYCTECHNNHIPEMLKHRKEKLKTSK